MTKSKKSVKHIFGVSSLGSHVMDTVPSQGSRMGTRIMLTLKLSSLISPLVQFLIMKQILSACNEKIKLQIHSEGISSVRSFGVLTIQTEIKGFLQHSYKLLKTQPKGTQKDETFFLFL